MKPLRSLLPFRATIGSGAVFAATLFGCGMITGLDDDYVFVADDGGRLDGGEGGAAACVVASEGLSDACRACLPSSCCALAACFSDEPCKRYALCRNQCAAGSAQCLRACDNRATSATRSALSGTTSQCSVAGSCASTCGW